MDGGKGKELSEKENKKSKARTIDSREGQGPKWKGLRDKALAQARTKKTSKNEKWLFWGRPLSFSTMDHGFLHNFLRPIQW